MALIIEDELATEGGAQKHGDASTSPSLDLLTARIVDNEASADVRTRPSEDGSDAMEVC